MLATGGAAYLLTAAIAFLIRCSQPISTHGLLTGGILILCGAALVARHGHTLFITTKLGHSSVSKHIAQLSSLPLSITTRIAQTLVSFEDKVEHIVCNTRDCVISVGLSKQQVDLGVIFIRRPQDKLVVL